MIGGGGASTFSDAFSCSAMNVDRFGPSPRAPSSLLLGTVKIQCRGFKVLSVHVCSDPCRSLRVPARQEGLHADPLRNAVMCAGTSACVRCSLCDCKRLLFIHAHGRALHAYARARQTCWRMRTFGARSPLSASMCARVPACELARTVWRASRRSQPGLAG